MKGKLWLDGHAFKNEEEYRRYRGLRELFKEGQIDKLEVNPEYQLIIDGEFIATYIPTFCFFNKLKDQQQVVQIVGKASNPVMELKMRLFEVLYNINIERW